MDIHMVNMDSGKLFCTMLLCAFMCVCVQTNLLNTLFTHFKFCCRFYSYCHYCTNCTSGLL